VKVSGGGTFFAAEQDVVIAPDQVRCLAVGYTSLGGVKLAEARTP
jgi:hypothetical protein